MPSEQNAVLEKQSTEVIDIVEDCLLDTEGVEIAYSKEYPHRTQPGVPPDDLPLCAEIKRYLTQKYPEGLFTHQHDAITKILGGANIVITTPTSSGKSLIFTIPAFQAFLEDDGATSLFIYPQKALANDQFMKLKDACTGICPDRSKEWLIARYDGATPEAVRPKIRERGQFVLTNPDMLHCALLQYHDKWKRFFSNLRYVVVDEAHAYHGVFGSSVAYILRRLRSIYDHYSSCPQFISASATMREPAEHLQQLTGVQFQEIGADEDGSTQGRKRVWLVRGSMHNYQLGRKLTMFFVDRGLQCLTFCPTRVSAERLVADLPDDKRIAVYRAGLQPREREAIEAGMKKGAIRAVFSTSALELGIDIGTLDVVQCVGLPNTMMSLWQRAGRVGRNGRDGAIVFIAADTPSDTYFTEHPDELFGRANESLVLNLQNRRLVCHHLACSIQEAGDEDSVNSDILGPHIKHALELRRRGGLSAEVFYSDDPHMRTPIRCADIQNYKLTLGDREIGEIDSWHLTREAYPHAIYLHGGRRYRVVDIFKSTREIRVKEEHSRNVTDPLISTAVNTRRIRAITKYPSILVKKADFDVTERLVQVLERTHSGDIIRQYQGGQGLAPHRLPTEGICIELLPQLCMRIAEEIKASNRSSVIHAVERLICGLFPVISGPCDLMDFDTFSEVRPEKICWYLYDRVHDGIDLAVRAYPRVPELLAKALDRVQSCTCSDEEGCFRCIRNPDEEQAVSKGDCIRILNLLCAELQAESTQEEFDTDPLENESTL